MTEQSEQAAAHVNSSGPEDQAANVGHPSDPIKTPCGCEGKLEDLERRMMTDARALKIIGQLAIVVALGMIYLLWQNWPKGD